MKKLLISLVFLLASFCSFAHQIVTHCYFVRTVKPGCYEVLIVIIVIEDNGQQSVLSSGNAQIGDCGLTHGCGTQVIATTRGSQIDLESVIILPEVKAQLVVHLMDKYGLSPSCVNQVEPYLIGTNRDTGMLTVYSESASEAKLYIKNLSGITVKEFNITASESLHTFDISDLEPGIYSTEVIEGSQIVNQKNIMR